MFKILAGIETEYGLSVENRGAETQIDDSAALVQSYPGERFVGWDYRYESPRADLRGFKLENLAYDPEDAKFDAGKVRPSDREMRSDRILPNGARLYNDHGHPEYSTPECWSLRELALHDKAGEIAVLRAARAYSDSIQGQVKIYKNNTDFHGASYGTHENYLVPRALGFQRLYEAVLPMLVARQVLTGAGKVGAEVGSPCRFQISQRADFFVEPVNAETLFRRPIFNTRDEPHGDPAEWLRLHVISGDANMMAGCTVRKIGLVKLAILLALAGEAPRWNFANPVAAFQAVSRDEGHEFCIDLGNRNWTTAYEVIESYLAAAESVFRLPSREDMGTSLEDELGFVIGDCRRLMNNRHLWSTHIDWAAKLEMLETFVAEQDSRWDQDSLRAYDLEYHNVDREEGLYYALAEMGQVDPVYPEQELLERLKQVKEGTRALPRGIAVERFGDKLETACWHSITFDEGESVVEVTLPPDKEYSEDLSRISDVDSFIDALAQ